MLVFDLDAEEIAEFIADDRGHLLVEIEGKTYSSEDVWTCDECGLNTIDESDLDDNHHCEHCAHEAWVEAYYA